MQLFLQRLFDGLTLGAIYAVVAVALVLIFKATTLINFAQGELAMFGAFIAYVLAVEQGLNIVLAIALAMVVSSAMGAAIERVLIRPFDPTDHLPIVLITLGIFLILNAVAGEIWNYQPRAFPSLFPKGPDDYISIGGARLFYDALGTWAMLGGMLFVLYLILNKTKMGLAFRAVSSNTESARLVGIRTGRVLMFGWALACAFGTLGSSLVAPRLFLQPNMMGTLLIFSFAAAALGGLDSLPGAVLGGIGVGLIQSLLVGYLGDWEPLEFLRNLSLAVAFVVILIVLSFKPSGLFGTSRVERV
jgi:branched-chain amino acid transport system permease protein